MNKDKAQEMFDAIFPPDQTEMRTDVHETGLEVTSFVTTPLDMRSQALPRKVTIISTPFREGDSFERITKIEWPK